MDYVQTRTRSIQDNEGRRYHLFTFRLEATVALPDGGSRRMLFDEMHRACPVDDPADCATAFRTTELRPGVFFVDLSEHDPARNGLVAREVGPKE